MKNQKGKYFKYAVGEIILVVIGILIALSINTWNEKQKNIKEAQFQLSKLKANLNSDKAKLKTVISEDSTFISKLIFCVHVLSGDTTATKDAFATRFQYIFNTNNFSPIRGTFDGLISSGKIELIVNQNLLDDLFMYYNNNLYVSWDSAMKDYSRNIIAPYIMNFDHVPNVTSESNDMSFTQFNIKKFAMPYKTIDDYKNNLFLINALRIKIQLFEGQKMQYIELQNVIDALITQINLEQK